MGTAFKLIVRLPGVVDGAGSVIRRLVYQRRLQSHPPEAMPVRAFGTVQKGVPPNILKLVFLFFKIGLNPLRPKGLRLALSPNWC